MLNREGLARSVLTAPGRQIETTHKMRVRMRASRGFDPRTLAIFHDGILM